MSGFGQHQIGLTDRLKIEMSDRLLPELQQKLNLVKHFVYYNIKFKIIQATVLNVNNLNVSFDSNIIIADLSFSIQKGDVVAIVGPNGAGKSVLFRALLGLVPYSGKVEWAKELKA